MERTYKKAQVAIFVIIALLIIGAILIYFFVFQGGEEEPPPPALSPVFEYYLGCIEQETKLAAEIAGLQGGRIVAGDYIPGSDYAPFSNHLNFLGSPIPYWYYISGNALVREQVPSKGEIESEMEDFIEEGLRNCDFEQFYQREFDINKEQPEVNVVIEDTKIKVSVDSDLRVSREVQTFLKRSHNVEIDSKLGKFYRIAREIYEKQKEEAFLENYTTDVLYLNAPVDGVEIECGPKLWKTSQVESELRASLEENLNSIKFEGNYYSLKNQDRKYFVVDLNVDEAVNVLYSRNWPTKIEIEGEGVDEELMIAEPIGMQQGLGILGFCYAPYHFVYDLAFPVLIQIYNNEELFQFPVAVVIDNNLPREAFQGQNLTGEDFDLCRFKNQNIEVRVFDINFNEIDANISYECFDQRCRLGESKNGRFFGEAPACVNGYLHIRADGFAEKRELFSTNSETFSQVFLAREHDVVVDLLVGGSRAGQSENAVISFVRDDGKATTLALPENNRVKLSEGFYDVKVYVYGGSKITIPGTTKTECVGTPKNGLLGFFGLSEEKCFDISFPETDIESILVGGGSSRIFILESELEKGAMRVNVERLLTPRSIEELQNNFELFSVKGVNIDFI